MVLLLVCKKHNISLCNRNQLLSLDLSSNNITDLKSTTETLKVLPKLRNLLLIGNPIYVSNLTYSATNETVTR